MGQEEVSEINESFDDNCNTFSTLNFEMDNQVSRKELVMKTNGKKRIFALLMSVMMIVSAMSVWAAYDNTTIGGTSSDRALCEIYLSSTSGQAYTTPESTGTSVRTTITVACGTPGTPDTSASGSSSASASVRNAIGATSTHQAGPYYTTLRVTL